MTPATSTSRWLYVTVRIWMRAPSKTLRANVRTSPFSRAKLLATRTAAILSAASAYIAEFSLREAMFVLRILGRRK